MTLKNVAEHFLVNICETLWQHRLGKKGRYWMLGYNSTQNRSANIIQSELKSKSPSWSLWYMQSKENVVY